MVKTHWLYFPPAVWCWTQNNMRALGSPPSPGITTRYPCPAWVVIPARVFPETLLPCPCTTVVVVEIPHRHFPWTPPPWPCFNNTTTSRTSEVHGSACRPRALVCSLKPTNVTQCMDPYVLSLLNTNECQISLLCLFKTHTHTHTEILHKLLPCPSPAFPKQEMRHNSNKNECLKLDLGQACISICLHTVNPWTFQSFHFLSV